MISLKTAVLLGCSLKMGAILAGSTAEDAVKLYTSPASMTKTGLMRLPPSDKIYFMGAWSESPGKPSMYAFSAISKRSCNSWI
jgi:hypothetical protein